MLSNMVSEAAALQRSRAVLEKALDKPVGLNPRPAGHSRDLDGELVLEGFRFLVAPVGFLGMQH